MLEIGSNLREARGRRGLPLAQVDADTHIRTRYLQALEEERFDVLPGPAYARGFLRTYADYLGLDADLFVDEYNARFAPPEDAAPDLTSFRPTRRRRRPRATTAAVLVVAFVAAVAWRLDSGGEPTSPRIGGALLTKTRPAPAKPPPAMRQAAPPARRASLVLTGADGSCWLLVRSGSADGRAVYEGMLAEGESLHFSGKRLWIRLGAPQNLDATLNGKKGELPGDTANVVVTPSGIRIAEG